MHRTVGLFKNPLQRSRGKRFAAEKGAKLFERSEFLAPPQQIAERGEPKAKLQGGFSFGSFLWTEQRKERTVVRLCLNPLSQFVR